MRLASIATIATITALEPACTSASFPLPRGIDMHRYVTDAGDWGDLGSLRFRPDLCDGYDLKPERNALSEETFVRFLQARGFDVQVQSQQVDDNHRELHYVFVRIPRIAEPVALRVAVLAGPDEAGRSLYEAILERGAGAWGVHRANIAVLGPTGSTADDVAFAGLTKLACWGTFTLAGTDDAFAIPGAYAEP